MVVGAVEGRTPLPQIFFGGAYSTPPDHLALFIGSTSKGREGRKDRMEGQERKDRVRESGGGRGF